MVYKTFIFIQSNLKLELKNLKLSLCTTALSEGTKIDIPLQPLVTLLSHFLLVCKLCKSGLYIIHWKKITTFFKRRVSIIL